MHDQLTDWEDGSMWLNLVSGTPDDVAAAVGELKGRLNESKDAAADIAKTPGVVIGTLSSPRHSLLQIRVQTPPKSNNAPRCVFRLDQDSALPSSVAGAGATTTDTTTRTCGAWRCCDSHSNGRSSRCYSDCAKQSRLAQRCCSGTRRSCRGSLQS